MYDLTNPRVVRELLDKYSLAPKKGYGQNFLINRDVPYRIAASAAIGSDAEYSEAPRADGVTALEIGPGVGSMTVCLSELFERVVAVEIDRGLIPLLEDVLADFENVSVVNADFLKIDLSELLKDTEGPVRVCANLPYYVTTPVIMKILEEAPEGRKIESLTVMIQREVADRLCATESDSEYGAVTVNGEVETRRGRHLVDGDIVALLTEDGEAECPDCACRFRPEVTPEDAGDESDG